MPHPAPELKFTPLDLKRVDAAGTFAGYASLFNKEDLGHDIVAARRLPRQPGERGAAGIKMLFQHNPAEPIGVWDQLTEDARGLYVRAA